MYTITLIQLILEKYILKKMCGQKIKRKKIRENKK